MNAVVRNRSTVLLELANSTQWTVQVLARGNSAGGNPQTQRGALKKAASASALALHSISTSPRPITGKTVLLPVGFLQDLVASQRWQNWEVVWQGLQAQQLWSA